MRQERRRDPGYVNTLVAELRGSDIAIETAAANAQHYEVPAALYGVSMVTEEPDSPHTLAGEIKGELYIGFAEHDPSVPPTVAPALDKALKAANARYRIETYGNADITARAKVSQPAVSKHLGVLKEAGSLL